MPGSPFQPMYQDARTKRQRYEALKGALWTSRATFDSHWKELGDWMLPRRTRFWATDRNKGDKRNQNIIDSTARFSARTLQSGLHAGLTSPARPWMKLSTPDPDLAKFGPVKAWLHEVTQRMLTVFLQTNLYNVLPITYGDLGVFGTGCMSIVADQRDLFRAYPYPIGSYALGLNERGTVSTFAREYELSVRQVVEQFGLQPDGTTIDWTSISMAVHDLWSKGEYEAPVQLCWMVLPNEEADPSKLGAKYLPFASCHFERGMAHTYSDGYPDGKFLRESGFHNFPIMAPRWDITGEDTYGTDCPGMTALGDIKQLQGEQRVKGKAISKMVDPPMTGPSALQTQAVNLIAGGITYVDTREGMSGLRAAHEISLNLEHLRDDIGQVQYRIQRAFYEDLFLMLAHSDQMRDSGQPVTAREVEERHEEKLLALGPVLERMNDELLDPLVDRVYAMMDAAGMIPEPPEQLHGVKLKAEYTSIMHQAQKLVGVVGQDRFLQSMLPLMEHFPEIRNKIDANQVVNDYADMLGIDPNILRSDEDAQALTDQQNKQAAAQAQADQAAKLGQAVKAAGTTPMQGDTALNRIVSGVTGGAAMSPSAAAA